MQDYINQIIEKVKYSNPIHYKFLLKNTVDLIEKDRDMANEYLDNFISVLSELGITFDNAVEGYINMINMIVEEQMFFFENNRYRYSTFDEAYKNVYSNKTYMQGYMVGLAFSQFLWSNHNKIFRFFSEKINDFYGNKYLEIGAGHGLFFLEAMQNNNFKVYQGIDVSETSIMLTEKLLSRFVNKDYSFVNKDIFEYHAENEYDFITIGEVLEHLEKPHDILMKVKEMLTSKGRVFISTCANAPAIDHIYLFKSVNEIRDLVKKCGFIIESEIAISPHNIPLEDWENKKANINYAAILKQI